MSKQAYYTLSGYNHVEILDEVMTDKGLVKDFPTTRSYFFRTVDINQKLEAIEKINSLFLWLKENNYLEICDIPSARVVDPVLATYAGNKALNIDVDVPEDQENPQKMREVTIPGKAHRGRGRPKGSKNTNHIENTGIKKTRGRPRLPENMKKKYIPTGGKRGRPRKNPLPV